MAYFASAVSLIAGVAFCVPVCAQERATQTMTLSTLSTLPALFLLCDIPTVRTNIRKVPRWSVYAIDYLAKKK